MKTLILIMSCLLLSACVKSKKSSNIVLLTDDESKQAIESQCDEINQTGDIKDLLKKINSDAKYVLKLLDARKPEKNETLIRKIAARVNERSEQVETLSQSEWNTPQFFYEISWLFKDQGGSEALKVYFQGEERSDLLERVNFSREGLNSKVSYTNYASLLEYCQLRNTLMILVQKNDKFFNLYVGEK